jgi:hypothetical protein
MSLASALNILYPSKRRIVPFDVGSHAPDFVIVRHEPDAGCVLIAMHMTSHQVMTRLLKLDSTWTLEEMWAKGASSSMILLSERKSSRITFGRRDFGWSGWPKPIQSRNGSCFF